MLFKAVKYSANNTTFKGEATVLGRKTFEAGSREAAVATATRLLGGGVIGVSYA
jgi:hypothetical protein